MIRPFFFLSIYICVCVCGYVDGGYPLPEIDFSLVFFVRESEWVS